MPSGAHVSIKLFDSNGTLIAILVDEYKIRGVSSIDLNLKKINNYISSGIYFVTMNAENFSKTLKINYLK
jgi:hypothetical protein